MKKILLLLFMLKGFVSFGQVYMEAGIKEESVVSGDTIFIKHLRATETYYTLPPTYGGWEVVSIDTLVDIDIATIQDTPSLKEWNGNNIIQISSGVHGIMQDYDTIPVIMLVSDTSNDRPSWAARAFYIKGYEVRTSSYFNVNDKLMDVGNKIEYLDKYKQPLNKNIVVWMAK